MPRASEPSLTGADLSNQPVAACTIVSNNYLAYAKVFAESYALHHPGASVFACIVDEPDPGIRYADLPFEVVFAGDLPIPNFANFAFRYDILELNTAVKPALLKHLRDRHGLDRVLYMDPDILVMSPLVDIHSELTRRSVLLTPHITEPLDNHFVPSERAIRMSGIYNLGFLGIRLDDSTAAYLDWWSDRLHRFCISDPQRGLFVDQSWMDFAPAMLDEVGILRQPHYNIAYWNLTQRRPRQNRDRWEIDGHPVGFFHFSGFRRDDLDSISNHQNRLSLAEVPDLKPLFEEYRQRLDDAGHAATSRISYAWSGFRGIEVEIPALARRVLRRTDPGGLRWKDPFDALAEDSFLRWLVEPLEFSTGTLNRFLLSLWEDRGDLIREFPDLCGADLPHFIHWLENREPDGGETFDPFFTEAARALRPEGPAPPTADEHFRHYPYEARLLREPGDWLEDIDLSRPGAWTKWLNDRTPGNDPDGPLLTRLALAIYFQRPDLQQTFPDPFGADRRDYAYWFCHHGADDWRLHLDLVSPTARSILDSIDLTAPTQQELEWLNGGIAIAPDGSDEATRDRWVITRVILLLHRADPELRNRFPDLFDVHRGSMGEWYIREGKARWALHPWLVGAVDNPPEEGFQPEAATVPPPLPAPAEGPGRASSPPAARLPLEAPAGASPLGVNVVGSLDSPTGVGQVARGTIAALQAAEIGTAPISADADAFGMSMKGRLQLAEGAPFPVTLLHVNADMTPYTTGILPTAVAAGFTIGYWFWELAYFPKGFYRSFDHLNELWAPTEFCRRAFEPLATVPIRVVPPHVPRPEAIDQAEARRSLGLDPDRFYFFFCFDVASIPERKNPFGAIEAIRRLAQESATPVGLILRITRASQASPELALRLREAMEGAPVKLFKDRMSRRDIDRLLNASDAYLSLHRSEGLGLLPIETLYLEKPVVFTDYSGVTDFLDETTAFPVPYRLQRLGRDHRPYPSEAVWADPDIAAAVEQMHRVVDDREEARRRSAEGARRVDALFGLEAAKHRLREEFSRIRDGG